MPRAPLDLNRAIQELLADVSQRMWEFSHVEPSRILVVAGEARRASRGSVKPLAFSGGKSRDATGLRKPVVRVHGRRMLYCITLRPLFFRSSTPPKWSCRNMMLFVAHSIEPARQRSSRMRSSPSSAIERAAHTR